MMAEEKPGDFVYLKRYHDGQYKEVWDELMQLEEAVFEEPLYTDALAVARATMQRVRINIERLISRLLKKQFVFGYDHRLQEQLVYALTSSLERGRYGEMHEWVVEQPLVFWSARQREEEHVEEQELLVQHPDPFLVRLFDEDRVQDQQARQPQHLLGQLGNCIPLSIRAWFEEIAAINFFGYHPYWEQLVRSFRPFGATTSSSYLMSHCDPLQIRAFDEQQWQHVSDCCHRRQSSRFELAPDRHGKEYYGGTSSPYSIDLPQARIDALMPTEYDTRTFVEYLRVSMAWAGFPGMMHWPQVPQEDLLFLTNDLLPF